MSIEPCPKSPCPTPVMRCSKKKRGGERKRNGGLPEISVAHNGDALLSARVKPCGKGVDALIQGVDTFLPVVLPAFCHRRGRDQREILYVCMYVCSHKNTHTHKHTHKHTHTHTHTPRRPATQSAGDASSSTLLQILQSQRPSILLCKVTIESSFENRE